MPRSRRKPVARCTNHTRYRRPGMRRAVDEPQLRVEPSADSSAPPCSCACPLRHERSPRIRSPDRRNRATTSRVDGCTSVGIAVKNDQRPLWCFYATSTGAFPLRMAASGRWQIARRTRGQPGMHARRSIKMDTLDHDAAIAPPADRPATNTRAGSTACFVMTHAIMPAISAGSPLSAPLIAWLEPVPGTSMCWPSAAAPDIPRCIHPAPPARSFACLRRSRRRPAYSHATSPRAATAGRYGASARTACRSDDRRRSQTYAL